MQVISWSAILLCFALVKSTVCGVHDNNEVIFRGDKDRFTRRRACNESKAVCFDETCVYCQCKEGQTFVRTRGSYGECISNELLVYATSEEAYFLIQNYLHEKCLYYGDSNGVGYVRKGTCYNNWKYYWIWTKNGQLLNWDSLKCMTEYYVNKDDIHLVVMKTCNTSNPNQLWKCERFINYNIIKLRNSDKYLHDGDKYLHDGKYKNFVTAKKDDWPFAPKWEHYGSKQDFCSQAVGCETFVNGSSIIILNKTKFEENSVYSGKKDIDLQKTKCSFLQSQYLHNDTWKPLDIKNSSFDIEVNSQVSLKWNLEKTPKSWGGLMVKVQFKYQETIGFNVPETEHCVVIKYTGTFKAKIYL